MCSKWDCISARLTRSDFAENYDYLTVLKLSCHVHIPVTRHRLGIGAEGFGIANFDHFYKPFSLLIICNCTDEHIDDHSTSNHNHKYIYNTSELTEVAMKYSLPVLIFPTYDIFKQ